MLEVNAANTSNTFNPTMMPGMSPAQQSLFNYLSMGSDTAEDLLHQAFREKGGKLWNELQFLLFNVNLRMMRHGHGLGSERCDHEWRVRNMIERVEQHYLPKHALPNEDLTPESFVEWLKEKIAAHRVNHSPLFDLFDSDDLSEEELRLFLANYRVNM